MVEDGNEEEKLDLFSAEGEASGYISLDQARVLAMRTARESPGEYGPGFKQVPMAFEVVGEEETEDHYVVTLHFRPQGEFAGAPGREQFFIEKEGVVAHRQVLGLPKRRGGVARRVAIGVGAVTAVTIVAVVAVVLAGRGEVTTTPQGATAGPESPKPAAASAVSPTPRTLQPSAPPPIPTQTPQPIFSRGSAAQASSETMARLRGTSVARLRMTSVPPPTPPRPLPTPAPAPIRILPVSIPTPTPSPAPSAPGPTPAIPSTGTLRIFLVPSAGSEFGLSTQNTGRQDGRVAEVPVHLHPAGQYTDLRPRLWTEASLAFSGTGFAGSWADRPRANVKLSLEGLKDANYSYCVALRKNRSQQSSVCGSRLPGFVFNEAGLTITARINGPEGLDSRDILELSVVLGTTDPSRVTPRPRLRYGGREPQTVSVIVINPDPG